MPKAQSRKRGAAEEYESDDGFVEDAPKTKKSKQSNAKGSVDHEMKKDDDGNEYWDISGKRRLTVQDFKGNTMISIREYYEQNGKMLPGKKGISLNADQFRAFVELLPQIDEVLHSKGIDVPRPRYDQLAKGGDGRKHEREAPADSEDEGAGDDDKTRGEEDDEAPTHAAKSRLEKFRLKKNHEATSDEDE